MKPIACSLMVLILTAACGLLNPTASALDAAEQQWKSQGIASYRIRVLAVSIWHGQIHDITVRGGAVAEQSATCIPSPLEDGKCQVKAFEPESFTVPGLFALARDMNQGEGAQWTKVKYDATYGYPTQISFDNPNAVDDDYGYSVMSFEVLP